MPPPPEPQSTVDHSRWFANEVQAHESSLRSTTLNPWEVRPFSILANDREQINTTSGANKHRDDGFLSYTRRLGNRVQWSARVHVRNIGIGDELIPAQANPDGSIAAFRIREPQNWTISNTFSF